MLWPLAFAVSGIPGQTWLQHGIVALSGFAVLLMLFVLGGMGGGDVKLGTAVFAWAGWHSLLPCLFVIGVAGLVLALLGLLADWLAAKATNQSQCRKRRMWHAALYALSANRGVPYGVALAMGGLVALPAYW